MNISAMLIAASTVRMPQLKSLRTITIFRQKKLDYHESNAKIAFTATSDATVMTVISRTRQTVQERRPPMKTIPEIMRVIISGILPRYETGIIMEILAYEMAYDGRY